jgi:23S rRNA pseudouridine2605 synthase
VISVGRLDLNSEGLLLLTNDGELSRRLELPSTGWPRRYRVRVHGAPTPEALAGLAKGVEIDGVKYGPIEALLERVQGSNAWLLVTLREGKNREIRRVMESLGLVVNRLIRVAYGPFQLGLLEPGHVEEVRPNVLRDQVGRWLADHEAGLVQTAAPAPEATAPAPVRRKPPRPMLRLDAPGPANRSRRADAKPGAKPDAKARAKPDTAGAAPKPGRARPGPRGTPTPGPSPRNAPDRRRKP